jgi:hypothetical protein
VHGHIVARGTPAPALALAADRVIHSDVAAARILEQLIRVVRYDVQRDGYDCVVLFGRSSADGVAADVPDCVPSGGLERVALAAESPARV